MSKSIAIIGVTGTQGSSVARIFLEHTSYKIIGITRDPSKPASLALQAQGVEIRQADIDDPASLKTALAGASLVFGNTAYPNEAVNAGMQQASYAKELQQGKNIADAVASLEGLEMFVWSSLSASSKWSQGRYRKVYHFDSKAHVVEYVREKLPGLAEKMSVLQMGLFVNNWQMGQVSVPWEKKPNGSMLLRIPGSGDTPVPFVVPSDAGIFVLTLTKLPLGTNLLAFADKLTWAEYVKLWTKTTGHPATFEKTTVEEHAKLLPGGFGEEIAEMYGYMVDFGYDGGDPSVTQSSDIKLALPVTSLAEYIATEDWAPLLSR